MKNSINSINPRFGASTLKVLTYDYHMNDFSAIQSGINGLRKDRKYVDSIYFLPVYSKSYHIDPKSASPKKAAFDSKKESLKKTYQQNMKKFLNADQIRKNINNLIDLVYNEKTMPETSRVVFNISSKSEENYSEMGKFLIDLKELLGISVGKKKDFGQALNQFSERLKKLLETFTTDQYKVGEFIKNFKQKLTEPSNKQEAFIEDLKKIMETQGGKLVKEEDRPSGNMELSCDSP